MKNRCSKRSESKKSQSRRKTRERRRRSFRFRAQDPPEDQDLTEYRIRVIRHNSHLPTPNTPETPFLSRIDYFTIMDPRNFVDVADGEIRLRFEFAKQTHCHHRSYDVLRKKKVSIVKRVMCCVCMYSIYSFLFVWRMRESEGSRLSSIEGASDQ